MRKLVTFSLYFIFLSYWLHCHFCYRDIVVREVVWIGGVRCQVSKRIKSCGVEKSRIRVREFHEDHQHQLQNNIQSCESDYDGYLVVTRVCPAAAMLQSGQYPSSVLTGRGAAPEPHLYGDPDKLHRLGAKWCLILGKLPRVNFHMLADQTQSYLKRLLFIKHFSQSLIRNCTSLHCVRILKVIVGIGSGWTLWTEKMLHFVTNKQFDVRNILSKYT